MDGLTARKVFLDHFKGQDHHYVPGSGTVPEHDPTLLFTNAGMNQFKTILTGVDTPANQRVVNYQRCIRAGGKHNDLKDVGYDTYHHTFFEMLGNWSFGDYGKAPAIKMAWDLLTEKYKLDPERMYATYFAGDEKLGLAEDSETKLIWLNYLPEDRVLPGSAKDNFWEMGETGPCGPCTEIHYDHIGERNAAKLVNQDSPEVVELWNLVFIQYNRTPEKMEKLPQLSVDTGMGFERLVSILQGKFSNYDTDLFAPIFRVIQEITKAEPYEGKYGPEAQRDTAYRILADHLRTLTIALNDGGRFGANGASSVLRVICRRALLHLDEFLQGTDGMLALLMEHIYPWMIKLYPDLEISSEQLVELITEEEVSYRKATKIGLKQTKKKLNKLLKSGETVFAGEEAFKLYSSLGIPLDLQQAVATKMGCTIDHDGYEAAALLHSKISKKN